MLRINSLLRSTNRLSREAVDATSLAMVRARLDGIPATWYTGRCRFLPNLSILQFCVPMILTNPLNSQEIQNFWFHLNKKK